MLIPELSIAFKIIALPAKPNMQTVVAKCCLARSGKVDITGKKGLSSKAQAEGLYKR